MPMTTMLVISVTLPRIARISFCHELHEFSPIVVRGNS
jgi:hypothetical protein